MFVGGNNTSDDECGEFDIKFFLTLKRFVRLGVFIPAGKVKGFALNGKWKMER